MQEHERVHLKWNRDEEIFLGPMALYLHVLHNRCLYNSYINDIFTQEKASVRLCKILAVKLWSIRHHLRAVLLFIFSNFLTNTVLYYIGHFPIVNGRVISGTAAGGADMSQICPSSCCVISTL